MLQLRAYSEKDNVYVWLDKTFLDSEKEKAEQYAREISIKQFGVVIQKVRRKQKGFYHVKRSS
jgi:hypothetical protein